MRYFILGIIAGSIVTFPCVSEEKGMVKIKTLEYGDVSGKILEKGTNNSLGAAKVWVYDKYGGIITVMSTDMDGKYSSEYRHIPVGNYYFLIPANKWGTKGKYLSQFYNNIPSWRNAVLVNIEKDKKLANIDFALEKGVTISGRIKCDRKPVNDSVNILVFDAHKKYSYTDYETATDSEGKYMISGITPGDCKIYINPKHYIATYYGQTEWWDSASIVTIENTKDTIKNIDVGVKKGGKISGYVLSEKLREPVSNVEVYCSGKQYTTDSLGYFEFAGLDTGEYVLRTYMGYQTESAYANQYYKQSATYEEADLIEVKPGQDVSEITIYLKEGGKIPITVIDENGLPIEKSKGISLIPQVGEELYGNWFVGGSTFEYPNIFPGKYTVYVSYSGEKETKVSYAATYYKDAERFEDANFIEVKGGYKTEPITIVMKPGGWIQGFLNHNGSSIDGDSTKFTILAYDTKSGELVRSGYNTFCGGYKVKGLPIGEYKLAALNRDSYFAIQYYGGGANFDDSKSATVKVKEGKPEFDINFDMVNANCGISGKVIDANKNDIPRLSVEVCAYDKTGHIVQIVYVRKGKYELKNLRQGKYAIRTVSKKYKDKWYNNIDLPKQDDIDNKHYFVKHPKGVKFLNLTEGQKITDIDFYLK